MATRKVLAQVAPGAGAVTALYTAPAATTVVSVLYACNTSATPTTITVSVAAAGAADAGTQAVYKLIPIGGNETIPLLQGATLASTDKVRVLNTLATVNFTLFGQEG